MAGTWKPRFRDATRKRLEHVDPWLTMADDSYQSGPTAELLREAARDGVLGSCLGTTDSRLRTSRWNLWISESRWADMVFSRTEVRFLVSGQAEIGASLSGSPYRVLQSALDSGGIDPFLRCLSGLTKLQALSVAEEYRGRGYGGQMLEDVVQRAERSEFILIYGSFDGRHRPHLADFYDSHGFTILDFGQGISLEGITGLKGSGVLASERERFFVRNLMP